jgi:hypothetical protein
MRLAIVFLTYFPFEWCHLRLCTLLWGSDTVCLLFEHYPCSCYYYEFGIKFRPSAVWKQSIQTAKLIRPFCDESTSLCVIWSNHFLYLSDVTFGYVPYCEVVTRWVVFSNNTHVPVIINLGNNSDPQCRWCLESTVFSYLSDVTFGYVPAVCLFFEHYPCSCYYQFWIKFRPSAPTLSRWRHIFDSNRKSDSAFLWRIDVSVCDLKQPFFRIWVMSPSVMYPSVRLRTSRDILQAKALETIWTSSNLSQRTRRWPACLHALVGGPHPFNVGWLVACVV